MALRLVSIKDIKSRFYLSIKNRLLLYFILIALLPTSVISISTYYKSKSIITQKVDTSINKNLNMINDTILQKFEAVNDMSTLVYLNPDFIKILSSERSDKLDNVDSIDYMYNRAKFTNEIASLDKILEIFNTANTTETTLFPKLYMYNRPEYLQSNFSDKITDLSVIENQDWYSKLPQKFKYAVIGPQKIVTASGTINTIRIAKRLFGLKHYKQPFAGLLTIDVPIGDFVKILRDFKPSSGSSVFIIDDKCKINISPDLSMIGTEIPNVDYVKNIVANPNMIQDSLIKQIGDVNMLISYKKILPIQWTIITMSPINEINSDLISFNKIMVIVIILCSIFAFWCALFLSDNVSSPIKKLVKSMSTVSDGDFNITLKYKRNDEFLLLINSYKKMINRIKELIDNLYATKTAEREAQLKALQAQINPHFLYNTLDSINWMAIEHKVPDISKMVTSLSDFFRYSLSKGKDIISLRDEIKQVESYLSIQRLRFVEQLDYSIDIPAELNDYVIVKLILQPIVENSIIHGIQGAARKGSISLTAQMEDSLIKIQISDDGQGTDVDKLNLMLKDSSNTSKSYGLRNVNTRIKRTFGEEYGITFYRNLPDGVKAVITIPALKTLEGYYVKNDYSR